MVCGLVLTLCIGIGIYLRFAGLGTFPMATDEYYTYRSIAFILDSGLPQFPCGGFYTRGLLYQYLMAPLLLSGIGPEFALRSVSASASLIAIALAAMLAARIDGPRIAVAVVVVLALSVWEIEMARFGRMYSPFQVLFLGYCYQLYCLIKDGDLNRWRWLLGLSLAAPFIWEGGILLPLANFVPILSGRRHWQPYHAVAGTIILLIAASFLSIDFRLHGRCGHHSSIEAENVSGPSPGISGVLAFFHSGLPLSSIALIPFAASTVIATWALVVAWRSDQPRTEVVGLWLVMIVTAAGQLVLATLLFVGLSMVGWISPAVFGKRDLRRIVVLAFILAGIWIADAVLAVRATGSLGPIKRLIEFPELLYSLAYPWMTAMPILAASIAIGCSFTLIAVWRYPGFSAGVRALSAVVILSVTIIGGAPTLYSETRYSFHLYPVVIILALVGFGFVIERSFKSQIATRFLAFRVRIDLPDESGFRPTAPEEASTDMRRISG